MKPNSKTKNYILKNEHYEHFKQIAAAAKFKPTDETQVYIPVQYCAEFACGKQLSLIEKLCGNRCFDHMGEKDFEWFGNY